MADQYLFFRRTFQDMSVGVALAAAGTTSTIITNPSVNDTIFVQAIHVYILTDAAQTMTFQDDNGTPKVIARLPSSPGVDTPWTFDFGPRGVPLTQGQSLTLTLSAAGLAAHIEVEAYRKRTAVTN